MATLIHFDTEDEFDETDWDSLGIGIGHRESIPEDTFESMGIGIGHRDDNYSTQTQTITIDISKDITEPTRACLICECKENSLSNLVYTDKIWLCDKCRAALLKIVKETEKDGIEQ